jgi:hypothetical protein
MESSTTIETCTSGGKFSHKSKKQLQWRTVKSSLWRSENNTENPKLSGQELRVKQLHVDPAVGNALIGKQVKDATESNDRGQLGRARGVLTEVVAAGPTS